VGFCQRGSEKMFCHAWYSTGCCHWLTDIPPLCQSLHQAIQVCFGTNAQWLLQGDHSSRQGTKRRT
jgi:hypothetical protein